MFRIYRVDTTGALHYDHADTSGGPPSHFREGWTTRLRARPQGDRLALSGQDDGLLLFDFERSAGRVGFRTLVPWAAIEPDFEPYRTGTDCAWDATGRYVYLTTERYVYQVDTEHPALEPNGGASAAAMAAAVTQLASLTEPGYDVAYYEIERGPDCRMYIGWPGSARNLSVVEYPSRAGQECELRGDAVYLRTTYFVALPNYPEYALWAKGRLARGEAPLLDTAVCDSAIAPFEYVGASSTGVEVLPGERELLRGAPPWTLRPNVALPGAEIEIALDAPAPGPGPRLDTWTIVRAGDGQEVARARLRGASSPWRVMLPGDLAAGTYIIVVRTASGASLGARRLVVTP